MDKQTFTYDEAQNFLIKNNYNIYLGEPILGKPYNEYNYEGKIALVVGNERYGITSNWYQYDHFKVFIPMYGEMKSLNVSIAGSILMYEVKMKKELLWKLFEKTGKIEYYIKYKNMDSE